MICLGSLAAPAICQDQGAAPIPSAKKRPKHPAQDPIVRDCVVVDGIFSQPKGWSTLGGVGGEVHNNCDVSADVIVEAAFFNSRGFQIAIQPRIIKGT